MRVQRKNILNVRSHLRLVFRRGDVGEVEARASGSDRILVTKGISPQPKEKADEALFH